MTVWFIVPWGRGIWYLLETISETVMTAWWIVPWGRRILISSWNPIRNPNDCMVNSLWYVEVTCSGYMICRSNMFWLTPYIYIYIYIYIEHKSIVAVWHGTEFPGIYAILGLGKPRGLCVILYFTFFFRMSFSENTKTFGAHMAPWHLQDIPAPQRPCHTIQCGVRGSQGNKVALRKVPCKGDAQY